MTEIKTSDKELFGGDLYITYTNQQSPFAKKLKFSSDQTIDLNNLLDVNMLRLTNTAYIMSYFDLKEDGLIKVSGPDKNSFPISHNFNLKRDINYYKNSILEKKDNIFNPKEIFIYQISDYYDRLFFSKKIIKSEKELDVREQYEFISQNYIKHAIYLSKAPKNRKFDSISLIDNTHKIGKGSILNIEKVKDGYEAFVNVTENGLLVLNQLPILKFWKAYVDNQETTLCSNYTCPEEYISIDGECYFEKDLQILQSIINSNANLQGLKPLEIAQKIGYQKWSKLDQ